jgi:superfamily II DNA or RNA helicase
MSSNPDVVLNRDDQKVADGIRAVLEDVLKHPDKTAHEIWISTAYFNPGGFDLIAETLEKANKVRILLGAEPEPPVRRPRNLADKSTLREDKRIQGALEGTLDEIRHDRDLLGFSYEADRNAERLVEWLDSDRVEVRRYSTGFLHGKAFIVATGNEAVIAGSSNFTYAGLSENEELNLGLYGEGAVKQVVDWYDRLWDESEAFDLAAIYRSRYEEHSPWLIWLKMLWERYGDELRDEKEEAGLSRFPLTGFQEDGVWRAKRILSERNGVIVADGVGLGKTFVAGALLRECMEDRGQKALVVVPAALESSWETFRSRQFGPLQFELISYDRLRNDKRLAEPGSDGGRYHLQSEPREYSMVVLDEAHSVRNPDTARSKALRRLLEGDRPKDLVLLTATPVNNQLADLYELIQLFVKDDHAFAPAVPSLQRRFKEAEAEDPFDLTPDRLFDVIDAVAVRRTRQLVKEMYADRGDAIEINGERHLIEFPKVDVRAVRDFTIDEAVPGLIDRVEHVLACDEVRPEDCEHGEGIGGTPTLSLARYKPEEFKLSRDESEVAHQQRFVGLLRTGVLKRFESSPYAFERTCRGMANQHRAFLELLEAGLVANADALKDWIDTDSDDLEDWVEHDRPEDSTEPADQFDVQALRSAVEDDLTILDELADSASTVSPEEDPKLRALTDELLQVLAEAPDGAQNDEAERNRRKVLIFSFFTDTVDWVMRYLEGLFENDDRFADYRGRLAQVTGQDGDSKTGIIMRFAPVSTEAPEGEPDEIDVLVCTDVLAEGLNLQQARNIINYDLPWNPMRLVQRHGRIDRLGSKHKSVAIRCMLDDRLDELLELDQKLRQKVAKAAASIGVDEEVIPGSRTSDPSLVYADDEEEIRRIAEEDSTLFETAGMKGNARSAEQYRRELAREVEAVQSDSWLKDLAWGSGSGYRSDEVAEGDHAFVFCIRVGDWAEPLFRLVEVSPEGPVTGDAVSRDTHRALGLARVVMDEERVLTEETHRMAYEAWAVARHDVAVEWQGARDPNNLRPEVPKAMREARELVAKVVPEGMDRKDADRLQEALGTAIPERIVKDFRRIVRSEDLSAQDKADQIAKAAGRHGLKPPPETIPIPEIREDDVHLVCWMAIEGVG